MQIESSSRCVVTAAERHPQRQRLPNAGAEADQASNHQADDQSRPSRLRCPQSRYLVDEAEVVSERAIALATRDSEAAVREDAMGNEPRRFNPSMSPRQMKSLLDVVCAELDEPTKATRVPRICSTTPTILSCRRGAA
jgi:hypothetical protein